MALMDGFCEWVCLHFASFHLGIPWGHRAKNLEVESYVFHGVDRTWNSAWNNEAQDSLSLRFVATVWTQLVVQYGGISIGSGPMWFTWRVNISIDLKLTLNCIRGGFHGTQHLVFRLLHFNAPIFRADNFCNCLNSSCASFGEKKIEVRRVVFALISINYHFGGSGKNWFAPKIAPK